MTNSYYYQNKVIGRKDKRADEKSDRYSKRVNKASKKWEDRGLTGMAMLDAAKEKAVDQAVKETEKIDSDFFRDMNLLDEHGKDAPKSRGFNTRRQAGGTARDRRDGLAMVGRTRVPRVDDSKVLMQAGGYWGGDTETGRGTMAGELAPKGSMSVREAGEDMHELSKRRRGMQGGGAASSYNRRYNNQNK